MQGAYSFRLHLSTSFVTCTHFEPTKCFVPLCRRQPPPTSVYSLGKWGILNVFCSHCADVKHFRTSMLLRCVVYATRSSSSHKLYQYKYEYKTLICHNSGTTVRHWNVTECHAFREIRVAAYFVSRSATNCELIRQMDKSTGIAHYADKFNSCKSCRYSKDSSAHKYCFSAIDSRLY